MTARARYQASRRKAVIRISFDLRPPRTMAVPRPCRTFRALCVALLILGAGHGALHGLFHVGVGGIPASWLTAAFSPKEGSETAAAGSHPELEERGSQLETAKGDFGVHLAKGLAIGLVAVLEIAAAILCAFVAARCSSSRWARWRS